MICLEIHVATKALIMSIFEYRRVEDVENAEKTLR